MKKIMWWIFFCLVFAWFGKDGQAQNPRPSAAGSAGCVQVHSSTGSTISCGGSTVVASLPSASANANAIYLVHDGMTSSDCTAGGGTSQSLCVSNGSSWVALGGGSSLTPAGSQYDGQCNGGGSPATLAVCNGWKSKAINAFFGGQGLGLSAGSTVYLRTPFACASLTSWSISVDAGTATVKVWKIATGTAIPTVANSINTSGVAISTGTNITSTTLSDFTVSTSAANDIWAVNLFAVNGATQLTFTLECQLQ